jgi:transposase
VLLSSMNIEEMGPTFAERGATTARIFETYVGEVLALSPSAGQMVMDKLGAHGPRRVRELIEERGCELVYLPSCTPDLNLLGKALSKAKYLLRKIGARAKDALIEEMGRAPAAVSEQDVRRFIAHCGYRAPAQAL